MFGRRRIRDLENQVATLRGALISAVEANEKLSQRPFLISIRRAGRSNTFVFARNGELIQIETMGLISDDVEQWKKDLQL